MRKLYSYRAVQDALTSCSKANGCDASVMEVLPFVESCLTLEDDQIPDRPTFYDWPLDDIAGLLARYDHTYLDFFRVSTDEDYRISKHAWRAPVRSQIFVFLHFSHHKVEFRKKDVLEFCYVLDGGARLFHEAGELLLKTGDIALVGPECVHDIVALPGSVVLGIQVAGARFEAGCSDFMRQGGEMVSLLGLLLYSRRRDHYLLHADPDPEILRMVRALLSEFHPYEETAGSICMNLLEILLYKISRVVHMTDGKARGTDFAFSMVMNEIRQRRNVSLKELAEQLNYSEGYLSHLIRQKTGSSFNQLVSQVRLDRARRMLEQKEIPIMEIAERAGYPSQNQFSRSFRSSTGMTPTQYRRNIQIGITDSIKQQE